MTIPLRRCWGHWILGCLLISFVNVACSDTDAWQSYKEGFVTAEGRVVDTGNNGVSHSEGQGWGMILAVAFDDRDTFERLWRWSRDTLTRDDVLLFSWRYDPREQPPVRDPNNATDGDLFIAWALSLAGERWDESNYRVASAALRAEIAEHLVRDVAGYTVLLPGLTGFEGSDYVDLNLSYWFMPALQHFATLDPEGPWQPLIASGRRLLGNARFGSLALPVDWMRLHDDGAVEPAPTFPPRFGFDAVRIPLYFSWSGFRADAGLKGISELWTEGERSPAWIDVQNGARAEFPVSAGVVAIQQLLAGGRPVASSFALWEQDYYSATLMMLSEVAATMPASANDASSDTPAPTGDAFAP